YRRQFSRRGTRPDYYPGRHALCAWPVGLESRPDRGRRGARASNISIVADGIVWHGVERSSATRPQLAAASSRPVTATDGPLFPASYSMKYDGRSEIEEMTMARVARFAVSRRLLACVFLILLSAAWSTVASAQAPRLVVFAAASLKDALDEANAAY